MAKSALRLEAIRLREQGESVKDIAKKLGVVKSTASLWVRDVILSLEQLERLQGKILKGGELGRIKGALIQKHKRIQRYAQAQNEAKDQLGSLSKKENLLVGIALYWAEGTKRGKTVDFCNSDPNLVKFMLSWFKEHFEVANNDFRIELGINEEHASREKTVKDYWSNLTGIPLSQFTKTSFKHAKLKKIYSNFNEYFGTPKIRVLQPSRHHAKLIGLIEALRNSAA